MPIVFEMPKTEQYSRKCDWIRVNLCLQKCHHHDCAVCDIHNILTFAVNDGDADVSTINAKTYLCTICKRMRTVDEKTCSSCRVTELTEI